MIVQRIFPKQAGEFPYLCFAFLSEYIWLFRYNLLFLQPIF